VVDNSGSGRARAAGERVRIIANERNVGFGTAINQAIRGSEAPYIAVLNDDATPHPAWLAALVEVAEARPKAGMFASQVRLTGTDRLDSAGMLIALDGSSKQRGHGEPPANFAANRDTLFPTGSAALYRRKMLDETGLFDERFFLYCEDTDLGLRARWAGWEAEYVAGAVVDHTYSKSAGRASALKAYYVERNRLYTVVKNFPFSMLLLVKFYAFARYYWHLVFMITRTGKAAEFRESGHPPWLLPFLVLRAHVSALVRLPYLFRERRRIFKTRRVSSKEFRALLAANSIPVRKVAEL
jgi:GT2 family glycosyltransferase